LAEASASTRGKARGFFRLECFFEATLFTSRDY
jgi:hypothetical protein